MQDTKAAPMEGESLVEWINRIKPNEAPTIEGAPVFDDSEGFHWSKAGWIVSVEIGETDGIKANWHNDAGRECCGFSINEDGERLACMNMVDGDPVWVQGWPL